jgi:hypothetical protein
MLHAMSNRYSGYSPQETDTKFNHALSTFNGNNRASLAVTCDALRSAHTNGSKSMCATCPVFLANKRGVLDAGRMVKPPTAVTVSVTSGTFTFVEPAMAPRPYNLNRNTALGSQYYIKSSANGVDELWYYNAAYVDAKTNKQVLEEDRRVSETVFYMDRHIRQASTHALVRSILTVEAGSTHRRPYPLESDEYADVKSVYKALNSAGASPTAFTGSRIQAYLESERTRVRNVEELLDDKMAWENETTCDRFILGRMTLSASDPARTLRVKSPLAMEGLDAAMKYKIGPDLSIDYAPVADAKVKQYVDAVMRPLANPNTTPEGVFTHLAGLAAPLIVLTPAHGLDVWIGGSPGKGKTDALKIIMSFYGSPEGGTHLNDTDSAAGREAALGTLRHLPVCYDEIVDNDATRITRAALSGSGSRGNKATREGKIDTGRAQYKMLMFSSSNKNPFTNLDTSDMQHQAAMDRKLLLDRKDTSPYMVDYNGNYQAMVEARETCYGWLGIDFISWFLWDKNSNARAIVKAVQERLDSDRKARGLNDGRMRFKYSALSLAYVAAAYLKSQHGIDLTAKMRDVRAMIEGTSVVTVGSVKSPELDSTYELVVQYAKAVGQRYFPRTMSATVVPVPTSNTDLLGYSVVAPGGGSVTSIVIFEAACGHLAMGVFNSPKEQVRIKHALESRLGSATTNPAGVRLWEIKV